MFTIGFKSNSVLIDELLKQNNISTVRKQSFIEKLTFKKKEHADVYFHTGSLDPENEEHIKNAKKIIVNSNSSKEQILEKINIDESKITVIYPAVNIEYKKPKEVKAQFCDKHHISPEKRIIFFTAKNLKASGVVEFVNTIMQLNTQDTISIIAGTNKQITNLKFQLSKFNYQEKIILLEDYENIDEIFLASDIFFLPTHNKSIATSVLKAMFCKCVVFTTQNNAAKELIDIFSTMESPFDRSILFKLEAVLQNIDDMKLIKKQNRKIAKAYTLEKQLQKVNAIIETI